MVEREPDMLLSVTILTVPEPLAQYTKDFSGSLHHRQNLTQTEEATR